MSDVAGAVHAPTRHPSRALPSRRAILVVLITLAAAPPLLAAVGVWGRPWLPTGDRSLQWLQTLDVGTRHTPLTGVYSRYGWDHPGPLLFWISSPLVRLFGARGLLVASGLVAAASAALAVRAAAARGGLLAAALTSATAVVLVHAVGRGAILDPWNPRVGLLPLFAFLVCVWAAQGGDQISLVTAIVAGSWCVQGHVGYAPVVLAAAAAGLAGRFLERRSGAVPLPRRHLVWAAGVGVVLWLPPIIQELTGSPGNLSELVHFFRTPRPTLGMSRALELAGRQLGVPAAWMGAAEVDDVGLLRTGPIWPAVLLVATVTGTAVAGWRRGRRELAGLAILTLITVPAAVIGMSRIADTPTPYLLRWSWAVGAMLALAALYGVGRTVASPHLVRPLAGAALALALVLGAITIARTIRGPLPDPVGSGATLAVSADIQRSLDPDGRYHLVWDDRRDLGSAGTGVAAALFADGWHLDIDDPGRRSLFRHRPISAGPHAPTILLHGPVGADPWTPPAGAELIARYDSLRGEAAAEADRLAARVYAQQTTGTPRSDVGAPLLRALAIQQGADPEDTQRLGEIQLTRSRLDAYLVPAAR